MRHPVVAGTFYPADGDELKRMISSFDRAVPDIDIIPISGIAPHAGYIYSGMIATYTHKAMRAASPKTVVIISPDHVGIATANSEIAVYPDGEWETPMGSVRVDSKLANEIIDTIPEANADKTAHEQEHSIEVQLPLIKYFLKDIKIVPLMMGPQDRSLAIELGETLAEIAPHAFVLASSDMSHYVPVEIAKKQDLKALQHLVELDDIGFYRSIASGVSACGYGPATAAMAFARKLRTPGGEILKYGTSSDVTNDPLCVGYASVIFKSPVV